VTRLCVSYRRTENRMEMEDILIMAGEEDDYKSRMEDANGAQGSSLTSLSAKLPPRGVT
jgi:hypothetical protein